MRRQAFVIASLCVGAASHLAQAGWGEFWQRVHIDFHRNNCWPQPFQSQDLELTRDPLIAMTDAGWRQNNTLSDHFFSMEDQSVNQAGEIKIRWIVTQAPPHRRTVFVLRGQTEELTAARVMAVQRKVEKFVPAGQQPDVLITDIIPPGASGDYFNQVDKQFKQSIPAPRLPAVDGTTNGSN
jgi:hypothetical protein